MKKNIVILGCTGSIGTRTLDIISRFPEDFRLSGISAKGSNPNRLVQIVEQFKPSAVVLDDSRQAARLRQRILPARMEAGAAAMEALAAGQLCDVDIVVSAQSGTSGLFPTVAAIQSGKTVALANKETLVTGGEWIISLCKQSGSRLLPVDSEHSAVYQCMKAVCKQDVRKLILTCSGGPFASNPQIDLSTVTPEQALAHPTWKMGRKITIDSATLMNKGLEIIEARWLFDIPQECIEVVIHPQSIIHSMVETRDGSLMAQMGQPDMRHPILYALTEGRHPETDLPSLDFGAVADLTFSLPDTGRFPCLDLARRALTAGGTAPAVLNTADERVVDAFCARKIAFTDIPRIIERVLDRHVPQPVKDAECIIEADRWTREILMSEWGV